MAIQIETDEVNWPTMVLYVIMIGSWVSGIAVAKGFWMTLMSVFIPPASWVVLASHLLN